MGVLRIGVAGAGYMGRSFAQLVHQHPLAELAGVADLNETAGSDLGRLMGVSSYPSTEALLEGGQLDGLIVATVESAHLAPCLAALETNAAVLVEKPIATTVEDGQAIIAAARRTNSLLMVGHVLRFDPRYVQVHDAVASGHIGTPLTVYARRLNGKGAQNRLRGRCSLPVFLGVHDYDAVRWIVGSEVRQVVARSRIGFLKEQGYDVEDATWALLEFENGVLAAVEEAWVLPAGHPSGFDQRLEVNGTVGRAELAAAYQNLTMMTDERLTWPDTALWPTIHGQVTGALEREVGHFIDCLRTGRAPLISGEDGLAALRIALAVEESARTGHAVTTLPAANE